MAISSSIGRANWPRSSRYGHSPTTTTTTTNSARGKLVRFPYNSGRPPPRPPSSPHRSSRFLLPSPVHRAFVFRDGAPPPGANLWRSPSHTRCLTNLDQTKLHASHQACPKMIKELFGLNHISIQSFYLLPKEWYNITYTFKLCESIEYKIMVLIGWKRDKQQLLKVSSTFISSTSVNYNISSIV